MCHFFSVGCTHDNDCPSEESCHNFVCIDPCKRNNLCSKTAKCTAKNHHPICKCPSGTEGDPMVLCSPVGCTSNDQCTPSEACINGACSSPCSSQARCGPNTKCEVENHSPVCKCVTGTSGDPVTGCTAIANLTGCVTDKDCPEGFGCIYEGTPIRYHSKVSAVYIRFDDPKSGTICRDLCLEREPCGQNAICTVLETLPRRTMSCSCPPGYHGDAKIKCRKSKDPTYI